MEGPQVLAGAIHLSSRVALSAFSNRNTLFQIECAGKALTYAVDIAHLSVYPSEQEILDQRRRWRRLHSGLLACKVPPGSLTLPPTNGEHCTGDGIRIGEAIDRQLQSAVLSQSKVPWPLLAQSCQGPCELRRDTHRLSHCQQCCHDRRCRGRRSDQRQSASQ